MKERLAKRKKLAQWIIFFGKIFILCAVVLLLYLAWSLRIGYINPQEMKFATSQKILRFTVPQNYLISLVTNIPLAQVIVLDNQLTGQRIAVQRRLWPRKDRLPQGFIMRFFHPGKLVEFRATFSGLRNPLILKIGNTIVKTHIVPYVLVESRETVPVKRGLIACLYCPVNKKSYYITSSASKDSFNPEETLQFIQSIQCD